MLNVIDNKLEKLEKFLFGINRNTTSIDKVHIKSRKYNKKLKKNIIPAWIDKNDKTECISLSKSILRKLKLEVYEDTIAGLVYGQRLERQFYKLNKKNISWAELSDKSTDSEDELKTTSKLIKTNLTLPPTYIEISRMKDVTILSPHQGQVTSVEWNLDGSMILTSGLDKKLKIWKINEYENYLLYSIFFKDMPIYSSHWSFEKKEIISSGRRRFFYIFDIGLKKLKKMGPIKGRFEKSLESFTVSKSYIAFIGKEGCLLILSSLSKRLLKVLKMNGQCRDVQFSKHHLVSIGTDGYIYFWDLKTFLCVKKLKDADGGLITKVAFSKSFLVSGNESGFVHIYKNNSEKPFKSLSNLTTKTTDLKLNNDNILVISSKFKKDSLRLVHLPTGRIFSNWPHYSTPLNYVNCTAFSPKNNFLAIGNAKGLVLLYKIKNFVIV